MLVKQWEKSDISAEDLLQTVSAYSDLPGTCFLYSGGDFSTSQRSFLFLNPKQTLCLKGPFEKNPWDILKEQITLNEGDQPEWVGFLSYEMGSFSDHEVRHPYQVLNIPDAFFQQSETVLEYDHRTLILVCYSEIPFELEWRSYKASAVNYRPTHALESEQHYAQKVNAAKELIYGGDIYQVNLSQHIEMNGEGHPYAVFYRAMQLNPAPFSAYIKHKDFTIVSTSPERFLSKKNNQLETRPIKGTAPRGTTSQEDQQNRETLLNSSKETAELLMITDLMRNDLGKISLPGTVRTLHLGILEAYTNVFHKHSWIVSVPQKMHSLELIRSCFPGGSITGCPKIRAMQVIADIEKSPRGIYTGAIGYICGNGDFDFNIAIRTMVFRDNRVSLHLGGGIVADSDPHLEYLETLYKGATLFRILNH